MKRRGGARRCRTRGGGGSPRLDLRSAGPTRGRRPRRGATRSARRRRRRCRVAGCRSFRTSLARPGAVTCRLIHVFPSRPIGPGAAPRRESEQPCRATHRRARQAVPWRIRASRVGEGTLPVLRGRAGSVRPIPPSPFCLLPGLGPGVFRRSSRPRSSGRRRLLAPLWTACCFEQSRQARALDGVEPRQDVIRDLAPETCWRTSYPEAERARSRPVPPCEMIEQDSPLLPRVPAADLEANRAERQVELVVGTISSRARP